MYLENNYNYKYLPIVLQVNIRFETWQVPQSFILEFEGTLRTPITIFENSDQ